MILSSAVLAQYPRVKLSPVSLSDFSRAIESAYHDDCKHNRLSLHSKLEIVACIIERYRACDGYPGAKHPLQLWEHRRQKLMAETGDDNLEF